jgi:hypothetical protein
MVNRGDAVNSNEWRNLPIEKQMVWRIPISLMLDLPLLRTAHPIITVADYLRLHNISESVERIDGNWDHDRYHTHPNIFVPANHSAPSLDIIQNHWFDPPSPRRLETRRWRPAQGHARSVGGRGRDTLVQGP